jgi:hypothetical protein
MSNITAHQTATSSLSAFHLDWMCIILSVALYLLIETGGKVLGAAEHLSEWEFYGLSYSAWCVL